MLRHLWVLNVALNSLGLLRLGQLWAKRRLLLRERQRQRQAQLAGATLPSALVPPEAEELVQALEEQCERYKTLSDKQKTRLLDLTRRLGEFCSGQARAREAGAAGGAAAAAPTPSTGDIVVAEDGDVDALTCPVCWTTGKEVAFNCGHMLCEHCSLLVSDCPACRTSISLRLRVFIS